MQAKIGPATLFFGSITLAMATHWLHEAAHALMAIAFGISGTMGTNTVRYTSEMSEIAVIFSTAAGPALTVLLAIIAAFSSWRWAPTIIFAAFIQRGMAAGISIIGAPNDETRLSLLLGLGKWSAFAVTVGVTAALFVWRWRKDQLGWGWLAISWIGITVGIGAMVGLNGVLPKIVF